MKSNGLGTPCDLQAGNWDRGGAVLDGCGIVLESCGGEREDYSLLFKAVLTDRSVKTAFSPDG